MIFVTMEIIFDVMFIILLAIRVKVLVFFQLHYKSAAMKCEMNYHGLQHFMPSFSNISKINLDCLKTFQTLYFQRTAKSIFIHQFIFSKTFD